MRGFIHATERNCHGVRRSSGLRCLLDGGSNGTLIFSEESSGLLNGMHETAAMAPKAEKMASTFGRSRALSLDMSLSCRVNCVAAMLRSITSVLMGAALGLSTMTRRITVACETSETVAIRQFERPTQDIVGKSATKFGRGCSRLTRSSANPVVEHINSTNAQGENLCFACKGITFAPSSYSTTNGLSHCGAFLESGRATRMSNAMIATNPGSREMTGRKHSSKRASLGSQTPRHFEASFSRLKDGERWLTSGCWAFERLIAS